MNHSDRFQIVATLTLAGFLLLLVHRAATSTPFKDELLFDTLYSALAQGRLPAISELIAAHYGHPYLLLKIAITITLLLGLPWVWLMYAQVVILTATFFVAWAGRTIRLAALPTFACCVVILSPRQWENLYWGMGVAFALFMFFSIAAFVFAERWANSKRLRWAYLALIAGGLASVSNGAGMVTLVLATLAVPMLHTARASSIAAALTGTLGLIVFIAAQAYAPSGASGSGTFDAVQLVDHGLRMLGHQFVDVRTPSALPIALGVASIGLLGWLAVQTRCRWREFAFEWLCVLLSLSLIIVVTFSRVTVGIVQPDASRYVPLLVPMTLGVLSALARLGKTGILVAATAVLSFGWVAAGYNEWFTTPYRKAHGISAHRELCLRGSVHSIHNMKREFDGGAIRNIQKLFCGDTESGNANVGSGKASLVLPPRTTKGWGPTETKRGQAVNIQIDGASAIWIGVSGVDADPLTKVRFGYEYVVPATVMPDLVTAAVPRGVIDSVGDYLVVIEEPSGRRTVVGTFRVVP